MRVGLPDIGVARHTAVTDERLVQDDRVDAGWIRRGEQEADRSTLGHTEQRRPIASDGVHHRADVVHPLLEARCTYDAVRETVAALVEHDDACERREALEELGIAGQFVKELDVGDDPGNEDEITRAVTDHLVSHADLAALRVTNLAPVDHRRSLTGTTQHVHQDRSAIR